VDDVADADDEQQRWQGLGDRVLRPAEPAEQTEGPQHAEAHRREGDTDEGQGVEEQRQDGAHEDHHHGHELRRVGLELAPRHHELHGAPDPMEAEARSLVRGQCGVERIVCSHAGPAARGRDVHDDGTDAALRVDELADPQGVVQRPLCEPGAIRCQPAPFDERSSDRLFLARHEQRRRGRTVHAADSRGAGQRQGDVRRHPERLVIEDTGTARRLRAAPYGGQGKAAVEALEEGVEADDRGVIASQQAAVADVGRQAGDARAEDGGERRERCQCRQRVGQRETRESLHDDLGG
jgi:hypothetical protein